MNFRLITRLQGFLILLVAGSMLTCLPWAWIDGDTESLVTFGKSIAISLVLGLGLLYLGHQPERKTLGQREGLLVVSGAWVLAGLVGALPFYLGGAIPDPADAIFESISGFTTTGASTLSNIEALPRALLFWRSLIQWLGGMGIVVLFVAVLPGLGMGGRFLYQQEAPGPAKAGLRPHIRDTAGTLWKIYLGLTTAEVIALSIAGMSPFEALCHTFTTMATGGYSTRNTSIAAFDSLNVEIVIIVFMFAAGVNFSLYANLWRGGTGWRGWQGIRNACSDSEFRLYLGLVSGATLLLAAILVIQADIAPLQALRQAGFQAVSVQTTTGYATADFDAWPPVCGALLVGLMFVGGSAGSTGGGMKVVRYLIMWKLSAAQVRRFFRPRRVTPVRVGDEKVEPDMLNAIAGYFVLFFSSMVIVSLILAFMGHDLVTAVTAAITCLANVGPGLAEVGPTRNFMWMGSPEKLVLSGAMIVGRLEVYTVIGLFSRSFWRP